MITSENLAIKRAASSVSHLTSHGEAAERFLEREVFVFSSTVNLLASSLLARQRRGLVCGFGKSSAPAAASVG